jgi:hypothetical protein
MNYVFTNTKELSYGMDIVFQGDFGSHYKFNNEWQDYKVTNLYRHDVY